MDSNARVRLSLIIETTEEAQPDCDNGKESCLNDALRTLRQRLELCV